MNTLERLDLYLLRAGLASSRAKAQALIRDGAIAVNGQIATKPSAKIDPSSDTITRNTSPTDQYVSRGGLKLAHALSRFNISLQGDVVLDIGASTGGFTDCALQHGAAHVLAVDVGTDQLHASLRDDPRVTSIEQCNITNLTPQQMGHLRPTCILCDVSFVSLAHILPHIARLLPAEGFAICLIKPQFEVGPHHVSKAGIVRQPQAHLRALQGVLDQARVNRLYPHNITYSPLGGKQKNIEYLVELRPAQTALHLHLEDLVAEAFRALN